MNVRNVPRNLWKLTLYNQFDRKLIGCALHFLKSHNFADKPYTLVNTFSLI